MSHRLRALVLLSGWAVSGLWHSDAVNGQTTGAIEGRALDPLGQTLSGVRVEATSPSLQGARTATTAADGTYRLPGLPPGSYTVQASMKGFTTVQRTARVTLNAMSTADFTLHLSAEDSLVVSGETPMIDLGSAATGTTYTATVLRRIAIIRNYADILRLQPGVQPDTAATQGRAAPLAIYGSTSIENLYLIDGINTNDVKQSFQGTVLPARSHRGSRDQDRRLRGRIRTRRRGRHQRRDALGRQRVSRGRFRLLQLAGDAGRGQGHRPGHPGGRADGARSVGRRPRFGRLRSQGRTDDGPDSRAGPAAGGTYPFDSDSNVDTESHLERRAEHERRGDGLRRSRRTTGATGPLNSKDPLTYTAARNLGEPLTARGSISSSDRRPCWHSSTRGTKTRSLRRPSRTLLACPTSRSPA